MQEERFNQIVEAQVDMALATFLKKNNAYSGTQSVDRLQGVKDVAAIRGVSKLEAISGMMAKHTMSIYSMMKSDQVLPLEVWNEKINDHINYLLLTIAAVHEDRDELSIKDVSEGQPENLNEIIINHFGGQVGIDEPELEALTRSESMRKHPSFKVKG